MKFRNKKPVLKISVIAAVFAVLPLLAFGQQVDTVIFPDNFKTTLDYQNKIGKTLFFNQTLVVTDNSQWQRYGEIKLSSFRLPSPTDAAVPNSTDYQAIVSNNAINWIYLDDGSSATYPIPLPFADSDGTRRTGSRVNNLLATLNRVGSLWLLYPVKSNPPVFYGNPRPTSPQVAEDYNIKVCSFNLEYYLASNYGQGYGADNEQQAQVQHNKILKALMAIDADIYGLVEVQTGQEAIQKLCNAMNAAAGINRYAFINDGSTTNGTFVKVGFIYRTDKVSIVGQLFSNNTGVQQRKKAQCFQLKQNNEKFVFSINHFKAKSGTTSDPQGGYNSDRVTEAKSVISGIPSYTNGCKDNDVLVMGDLNAYSEEDPLREFYNKGFTNLLKQQNDSAYSYVYQGLAGCLDHALANTSLLPQVASATVFHINADEPSMFEYQNAGTVQNNMYRCSDHDAVVVTLHLGTYSDTVNPANNDIIVAKISNNSFVVKNAEKQWITIYDAAGKQLLHKFIKEKEQYFDISSIFQNGTCIIILDDMISPKVKFFKLVF